VLKLWLVQKLIVGNVIAPFLLDLVASQLVLNESDVVGMR
jgi:hypothetical protein